MKKLGQAIIKGECKAKNLFYRLMHEEKGGTEVVAVILLIIVIIGLVVIFRDQLQELLDKLFDKINQKSLGV